MFRIVKMSLLVETEIARNNRILMASRSDSHLVNRGNIATMNRLRILRMLRKKKNNELRFPDPKKGLYSLTFYLQNQNKLYDLTFFMRFIQGPHSVVRIRTNSIRPELALEVSVGEDLVDD